MTSVDEGLTSLGVVVLLLLLCIAGVLSNALVLAVVCVKRAKCHIVELFITNLAIFDVLLAGVAIPLRVNQGRQWEARAYPGGDVACKLTMFVPLFSIMGSISTMVAISFERLFAIVKQRSLDLKASLRIIAVIWVIAVVTSAPQLYEYSVYEEVEEDEHGRNYTKQECGSHDIIDNFEMVYAIIVVAVSYVIPAFVLIINYTMIGRYLWKMSLFKADHMQQGVVSKNKVRIVKMLVCIATVFVLLWLPYFVLFTIAEVTGTDDSAAASSVPHIVKNVMIGLSTISNPVIYVLFNRRYRLWARDVCCCRGIRLHVTSNVRTSAPRTVTSGEGLHGARSMSKSTRVAPSLALAPTPSLPPVANGTPVTKFVAEDSDGA